MTRSRALVERGLAGRGHDGRRRKRSSLLVDRAGGDGRQVLTALEVGVRAGRTRTRSSSSHVEAALGTSALRYGRDDHYDVISAFIKSMRGSDPAGRGVLPGADAGGG